jgi:hypothetical protein
VPVLYLVSVEVIFDVGACLCSLPHFRRGHVGAGTIEVLLVLLHLQLLSFPLELCQLLRRVCDFIEGFLLFDLDLSIDCTSMVFFIDLVSQQLSVVLFHFLVPSSLLFLPHLASPFFDLEPIRDQSLFLGVSFVEGTDVLLGVIILAAQEHLIILNKVVGYVLVGEVFHLFGLNSLSHSLIVHMPLLCLSLHLDSLLLLFLLQQFVKLLPIEVFIYFILLVALSVR